MCLYQDVCTEMDSFFTEMDSYGSLKTIMLANNVEC